VEVFVRRHRLERGPCFRDGAARGLDGGAHGSALAQQRGQFVVAGMVLVQDQFATRLRFASSLDWSSSSNGQREFALFQVGASVLPTVASSPAMSRMSS